MNLSVTEMMTWQRCRRLHWFGSFNGLAIEPIFPPLALQLGKLIHKSHELWGNAFYLGESTPLWQFFIAAAAEEERKVKERYKERVGCYPSSDEMQDFQKLVFDLGRGMCVNYEEHWGSPLPEGFKMLQPEQTILLPIPNTAHDREWIAGVGAWAQCDGNEHVYEFAHPLLGTRRIMHKCDGSSHKLEMTLDALIQHEQSVAIFVEERKTYGNRPKLEVLREQFQFKCYVWGLTQLNIGIVGGVAYDGMWKRAEYNLKRYTPDDYFLRQLITFNQSQMAELEDTLSAIANDMARADNPYPNRVWQGCWDDRAFDSLCTAMGRGEDVAYIMREGFATRSKEGREDVWLDAE